MSEQRVTFKDGRDMGRYYDRSGENYVVDGSEVDLNTYLSHVEALAERATDRAALEAVIRAADDIEHMIETDYKNRALLGGHWDALLGACYRYRQARAALAAPAERRGEG